MRALLTDRPQTASDLAAFFFEGERIVSELLRCLEANEALGFASLDRKGWVAARPASRPVDGSQRKMKNWTIKSLQDWHTKLNKPAADMSDDDWSGLLAIYFELQFRSTPRAKELREGIRDRLILHRRFPGDDRTDDQLRLT